MSYVDRNLIAGETVCYRTHLHWVGVFWWFFFGGVFGLTGVALIIASVAVENFGGSSTIIAGASLLVIGVAFFATGHFRRASAEFAVTNKRIVLKFGVLKQRTAEMFLHKVESIAVTQTLIGRLLGYGTISVRGTGGTLEPFDEVPHPLEFRRQVQQQVEKTLTATAANTTS